MMLHVYSGLRGRFHQYYTEGKYRDCEKWRQDYDNCMKFRNKGTKSAAVIIILFLIFFLNNLKHKCL